MKIEMNNLRKVYNGITVLDIHHLVLPSNAITAVVGPNGAGKSTLLNLVGGLLERDSGQIIYNGEAAVPVQNMTLVFQEPYMISSNVRENIAYPMKLRKYPKELIQERIRELSKALGLEPLLTKKAGQLSLGEVQKVVLARALSFNPELLLLDEPSASIDSYTTSEIEKILKKLNREAGTTIVVVTHNLAQAKRLADFVVLLNQGSVIESCNAEAFFHHPSCPETKKFIKGELLV